MRQEQGTTLIELLLVCIIVAMVAATIALIFPRASKNIVNNNQRWMATNIANSQVQYLKIQPYASLIPTNPSYFDPIANPTCNCNLANFSIFPSTSVLTAGQTYYWAYCANYVSQGTWTSQCPSTGDTGFMNVVVSVSWMNGISTSSVTQGFIMTEN